MHESMKRKEAHTMVDAFQASADGWGPPDRPADSAPNNPDQRVRTATASSRGPTHGPRRATRRPCASSTSATRTTLRRRRRIVRDEYEAEDVTQHVFAKLMKILHKYEPRGVPFAAWILRVARNVAVDHMRARRAIPCEEVREPDDARGPRRREQT